MVPSMSNEWSGDSSHPSAGYMRKWNGSALLQVMACCLFGAKPLPEPMMTHCQLDPWEQISVKFVSKCKNFIQENASENAVCEMAGRDESSWKTNSMLMNMNVYLTINVHMIMVRESNTKSHIAILSPVCVDNRKVELMQSQRTFEKSKLNH